MSTTSKKPKILSATSLTKLVTKHATPAHSADKATSSSRRTQQSSPELNTVSDQHSVQSDTTVTSEGYTLNVLRDKISMLPKNISNELHNLKKIYQNKSYQNLSRSF